MGRTEVVTLTNMCMIYDDDGNVLVQDKINPDWKGVTFPGGHVEKGESFVDSVIREIKEETGLTIESPVLCGIKDWTTTDGSRYMVIFYKTNKFTGEPVSSPEGKVYWTKLEDIKKLKLAISMDKMLEVFINDDISELFYQRNGDDWDAVLK